MVQLLFSNLLFRLRISFSIICFSPVFSKFFYTFDDTDGEKQQTNPKMAEDRFSNLFK